MTPTPVDGTRSIELNRESQGRYTARNAAGASITFGREEGLLTPVELLLAALAGCSAVDVDTVTSRRTEPADFRITASGTKTSDEGGNTMADLHLSFHLAFADDDAGRQAAGMVERLVALSHDKNCTVSRTIERGTPVAYDVETQVGNPTDSE